MNEANGKTVKDMKSYRAVRSIKGLKLKRNIKLNRTHVLLDIYKCEDKALAKATLLEQKVKKVLAQFELEPQIQTFYQFQPFGVTAIVCVPGLHFTVHTWPEHESAAIDLYCFSSRKLATQICNQLLTSFKSGEYEMKVRRR